MKILSYFFHFFSFLASLFRYIMRELRVRFIWFCVIFMALSMESSEVSEKRAKGDFSVVTSITFAYVNDKLWHFYFRTSIFLLSLGCLTFSQTHNLSYLISVVCERSKPNKSIFNYLLLKEINSTTRKQICREKKRVSNMKTRFRRAREEKWMRKKNKRLCNIK